MGGSTPAIANLTNVRGTLFFTADDGTHGSELWKSDGNDLGTILVKDIQAGSGGSAPANLTAFDGDLFFTADDGESGIELWRSDGTEDGTTRVADIWSGTESSNPNRLTAVGDELFFNAFDGAFWQVWKSDGTEAGTEFAGLAAARTLANVNGTLFLVWGPNCRDCNYLLGRYDNTVAQRAVILRGFDGEDSEDEPISLTDVNGTLFFGSGDYLWKSDGTTAGTSRVAYVDDRIFKLINSNGTAFFEAEGDLWKSDGTEEGTLRVHNGIVESVVVTPTGTLYFSAHVALYGSEVWSLRPMAGDFNWSDTVDVVDVDLLFAAIAAGSTNFSYDLTGDGVVDQDDVRHLVENILNTDLGDADLNGRVDRFDVITTSRNYGRADTPSWGDGNFNGDERVDLEDVAYVQGRITQLEKPPSPSPDAVISLAVQARAADAVMTNDDPARATLRACRRNAVARVHRNVDRKASAAPLAESFQHFALRATGLRRR